MSKLVYFCSMIWRDLFTIIEQVVIELIPRRTMTVRGDKWPSGKISRCRRKGLEINILRDQIDVMKHKGLSFRDIGLLLGMSHSTVYYHYREHKEFKLARLTERDWCLKFFESLKVANRDSVLMLEGYIENPTKYTMCQVWMAIELVEELIEKKKEEFKKLIKLKKRREEKIKDRCNLEEINLIS